MICLFFKFGQILKFLNLLIARSPKNPVETLATPDGRRQFQGDTLTTFLHYAFTAHSDLVVDHGTSAVESSSPLEFLSLHAMWTPFGRLISYKIMSTISVGCDFTTKSGGIWDLVVDGCPPMLRAAQPLIS